MNRFIIRLVGEYFTRQYYGYRNIWDLILSENLIPEQIEFYEKEIF